MRTGDIFVVCSSEKLCFNILNGKCTAKGPVDASYMLRSYAGEPKLGTGGFYFIFRLGYTANHFSKRKHFILILTLCEQNSSNPTGGLFCLAAKPRS